MAARSGLRAARAGKLGTFVGKEVLEHTAISGSDAAERHGMANIVRKFQIAAEKGRLPTYGDEEAAPEEDRRPARRDVSRDAHRGREDVERSPPGAADAVVLEQIRRHDRNLDRRHGRKYDEKTERTSKTTQASAKTTGHARV